MKNASMLRYKKEIGESLEVYKEVMGEEVYKEYVYKLRGISDESSLLSYGGIDIYLEYYEVVKGCYEDRLRGEGYSLKDMLRSEEEVEEEIEEEVEEIEEEDSFYSDFVDEEVEEDKEVEEDEEVEEVEEIEEDSFYSDFAEDEEVEEIEGVAEKKEEDDDFYSDFTEEEDNFYNDFEEDEEEDNFYNDFEEDEEEDTFYNDFVEDKEQKDELYEGDKEEDDDFYSDFTEEEEDDFYSDFTDEEEDSPISLGESDKASLGRNIASNNNLSKGSKGGRVYKDDMTDKMYKDITRLFGKALGGIDKKVRDTKKKYS